MILVRFWLGEYNTQRGQVIFVLSNLQSDKIKAIARTQKHLSPLCSKTLRLLKTLIGKKYFKIYRGGWSEVLMVVKISTHFKLVDEAKLTDEDAA